MIGVRDPWHFQRWAFSVVTGGHAPKAVLTALAMMSDTNTGRCEAKVATIATGAEMGERTVRTHLAALEAAGLIARRAQYRNDGGRRGDEFLLLAPGIDEWPDGTPLPNPPGGTPSPGNDPTPSPSVAGAPPRETQGPPPPQLPRKNDLLENDHLGTAASAAARERASRIAEAYRSEVAPHLSKVAEWQPAMIKGAGLQVSTLMEGAPDAPWGMIAASAAAARQAGDLTTGSPVTALQFKLRDWTRGKLTDRRADDTDAQLERFRAREEAANPDPSVSIEVHGDGAPGWDDVETLDAHIVDEDGADR